MTAPNLYRWVKGKSGLIGVTAMTFGGHAFSVLLAILSLRLFTQLTSPGVFGAANLIVNLVVLSATLLAGPIANTQIRFQSSSKDAEESDAFTRSAMLWTLGAGLLGCVIGAVGWCVLQQVKPGVLTGPQYVLAAVLLVLKSVRDLFMNRFSAERRRSAYMALVTAEAVLLAIGTATLLAISSSVEAFLGGQIVAAALVVVFAARITSFWRRLGPRQDAKFRALVRNYGLAFIPLSVLNWISNMADRYALGLTLGPAAVGLYAAPSGIGSRLAILLNGAVADLYRPVLFAAANSDDEVQANKVFRYWLLTNVVVLASAVLALFLFGRVAIDVLLAPAYRARALPIMLISVVGYGFLGVSTTLDSRVMSLHLSSRLLVSLGCGSVANVVLCFALIPRFGTMGAALGNCASYVIQCTVSLLILTHALRTAKQSQSCDGRTLAESV